MNKKIGISGLTDERILLESDNCLQVEFLIGEDCIFFDGHFPSYKILPAVGQFAIVMGYASAFFDVSPTVSVIKRMKFVSPVLPGTRVILTIERVKDKFSGSADFQYSIKDSAIQVDGKEKVYSSGFFA